MHNSDPVLTPKQAAATLNLSLSGIYNLIRSGDLRAMDVAPSDRTGGKPCYRIRRSWLDEFEKARQGRGVRPRHEAPRLRRNASRRKRTGGFVIEDHLGL